ncbi:MAG: adenosylmethionine decarboxylase [Actinomycetia bacterium]|nr:adenosylmethionine decarboxylase [Actinomycetes bacterium]
MKNIGRHILVEFWNCKSLNSEETAREGLKEAVKAAGATLLALEVHKFEPHGITGIAIIAESHISIHTWPEFDYAAIDIFTCGNKVNPDAAVEALKKYYSPEHVQIVEIRRGILRG